MALSVPSHSRKISAKGKTAVLLLVAWCRIALENSGLVAEEQDKDFFPCSEFTPTLAPSLLCKRAVHRREENVILGSFRSFIFS